MPFDTAAFRQSLAAMRAAATAALPDAAEQMGLQAVIGPPPYGEPDPDETGDGLREGELLSAPETRGNTGSIAVYTVIHWRLGQPKTTHCADCLALAEGGPYTALTLPTTPGAGETECGPLCYCTLEAEEPAWTDNAARVVSAGAEAIAQAIGGR